MLHELEPVVVETGETSIFARSGGCGPPLLLLHGFPETLIDALAAAIPGKKTLLATATAVERRKDPSGRTRARVSYLRDHRLETVEADRVILTVPFFRLHQIPMDPPLSDQKWQATLTLARGQYTVVHLLMDKAARKVWTVPSGSQP